MDRICTLTQPMGMFLVVLSAMLFWLAVHQTIFGSRVCTMLVTAISPRIVILGIAGILVAWVYKIITWS